MENILLYFAGIITCAIFLYLYKKLNTLINLIRQFIDFAKENKTMDEPVINTKYIVEENNKEPNYSYVKNHYVLDIDEKYVANYPHQQRIYLEAINKAKRLCRTSKIIRIKVGEASYYFSSFNYAAKLFGVSYYVIFSRYKYKDTLMTSKNEIIKIDEILKDELPYNFINSYEPANYNISAKIYIGSDKNIEGLRDKEKYWQNKCGDITEEWRLIKEIKDGRGNNIYQKGDKIYISNLGRMRINDYITMTKKCSCCGTKICVLVYEMFIGEIPEGFICTHIDGNTKNNRVDNLTIMTLVENRQHQGLLRRNKSDNE